MTLGHPKPPKRPMRPRQRNSTLAVSRKPMQRGGKIKPKPRKASERERIYGSAERIAWMKSQPCVACDLHAPGFCDIAHVTTGGIGRKANADQTVPLCPPHAVYRPSEGKLVVPHTEGCHAELHRVGLRTFEKRHGIDLRALATEHEQKWQEHIGQAGAMRNSE